MATVEIVYTGCFRGPEEDYIDTDGLVKKYQAPYLIAVEPMGRSWILKQEINFPRRGYPTFTYSQEKGDAIAKLVRDRGFIDDTYWVRGPTASATTRAQE